MDRINTQIIEVLLPVRGSKGWRRLVFEEYSFCGTPTKGQSAILRHGYSHELTKTEPTRFTGTGPRGQAFPVNPVENLAAVKTRCSPLEESDSASPWPGIVEWDRDP